MKYFYTGVAAFIIGAAAMDFITKMSPTEPQIIDRQVLVTTSAQGQATIQEVYQTLIVECRKVPWKYDPPQRPTCEKMAMHAVTQLLVDEAYVMPANPLPLGRDYVQ